LESPPSWSSSARGEFGITSSLDRRFQRELARLHKARIVLFDDTWAVPKDWCHDFEQDAPIQKFDTKRCSAPMGESPLLDADDHRNLPEPLTA
jgi:hypothetical protein